MSHRDDARQRRHNDRVVTVAAVIAAGAAGFALGVRSAARTARG